jgi:hypothetical protein
VSGEKPHDTDDEIVPPYDDLTSRGAFAIGLYHGASMLAQLAYGDARGMALHARYVMQASGGRLNPRTVPAALQPAEHPPEVADAPRELDG